MILACLEDPNGKKRVKRVPTSEKGWVSAVDENGVPETLDVPDGHEIVWMGLDGPEQLSDLQTLLSA